MGLYANTARPGETESHVTTFVGSPNSRYYVGVRGDKILFFHQDTVVWDKRIPFEVFQVVAVGGNGNVFVRAPEGIYVYDAMGRELHAPLARWSRKALQTTSSQLAALRVSSDGTRLCIERSTLQTRLSQKIFEFLSSNKVEPNTTIHEIFFSNTVDDSLQQFYRCMSDTKSPQKFLWDISVDFMWIVLAEPEKKGTQIRFSVAHVESKTIYHEFAIPNVRIHALKVSLDGTALVDLSQDGRRAIVVVTLDSVKYSITVPSMDYTVRHIGKGFVAIMTQTTPFILIKGFDDRLIARADLRPLQRLKMDYDIHFNGRDAIALVSMTGSRFKVIHTSVEFLEVDAQRWEQIPETRGEPSDASQEEPQRPVTQRPRRLEVKTYSTLQPMVGAHGLAPGIEEPEAPLIEPPVQAESEQRYAESHATASAEGGLEGGEPVGHGLQAPPPAVEPRQAKQRSNVRYRTLAAPSQASPSQNSSASSQGRSVTKGDKSKTSTTSGRSTRKSQTVSTGAMKEEASRPTGTGHIIGSGRGEKSSGHTKTGSDRTDVSVADGHGYATTGSRPEVRYTTRSTTRRSAAAGSLSPETDTGDEKTPRGLSATDVESTSMDETEQRRLRRMLDLLEERFVMGQVSETTYVDLKSKYVARLGDNI